MLFKWPGGAVGRGLDWRVCRSKLGCRSILDILLLRLITEIGWYKSQTTFTVEFYKLVSTFTCVYGNGLGKCLVHDDVGFAGFVMEGFSHRTDHKVKRGLLGINMLKLWKNRELMLDRDRDFQSNINI